MAGMIAFNGLCHSLNQLAWNLPFTIDTADIVFHIDYPQEAHSSLHSDQKRDEHPPLIEPELFLELFLERLL